METNNTAEEIAGLALAVIDFEARKRETMPKKTICAKCVHFVDTQSNPMAPGVWYNLRCAAPKVQSGAAACPQTGKVGYLRYNDLGGAYLDETPMPYCRDINPDGKCGFFSVSATVWRAPERPRPVPASKAVAKRGSPWAELCWATGRFWRHELRGLSIGLVNLRLLARRSRLRVLNWSRS